MTIVDDSDKQSLLQNWPTQGVAVVVGAGGMSTVVAQRLGQNNRLLLADIDSQKLEFQADKLRNEGIQLDTAVCDVTDSDAVARLVEKVRSLGRFLQIGPCRWPQSKHG